MPDAKDLLNICWTGNKIETRTFLRKDDEIPLTSVLVFDCKFFAASVISSTVIGKLAELTHKVRRVAVSTFCLFVLYFPLLLKYLIKHLYFYSRLQAISLPFFSNRALYDFVNFLYFMVKVKKNAFFCQKIKLRFILEKFWLLNFSRTVQDISKIPKGLDLLRSQL